MYACVCVCVCACVCVISNCGKKVSEFLDHHLKPIMQEGWSYIKDTEDFLKKIQNMGKIPQDSILVTADVVGLYPSIPHNAGLNTLNEALDCRQNKKIPTFVLTNNCFKLGQKVFHQISATAVGTKFTPPYECIFMDKFETNFFKTQKFQLFVRFRYIDGVFFLWTHGKEELENFMKELNSFRDHIKFTFKSDEKNINYLDVNINLFSGHLMTNMYVEPTDRHQYLDYSSSQPNHIKRSIVYSQSLRARRLCSLESDFLKHCTKMKSWFLKRGYPESMIDEEMKKVRFSEKGSNNSKESNGVPFVVTYHPS